MTSNIALLRPPVTATPLVAKHTDAPREMEQVGPTQNNELPFAVSQLSHRIANARAAAGAQQQLCNQLAAECLGTALPLAAELMQDPALMEEVKRKQLRESNLVSDMRKALVESEASQNQLLQGIALFAALGFLTPPTRPVGEEPEAGLPGFISPMENPADLDTSGLIWNSHSDFYAQIMALIGVLQTEWLVKYQETMEAFLKFYQGFSDAMELVNPWGSGDKGDIQYDFKYLREALEKLKQDFGLDMNALTSFTTKAGADAFVKSMGLPLSVTGPGADGKYHVKVDMDPINDILYSLPDDGVVTWDSARYNAWVSNKDSNVEQIKHVSKVLGEKLSEVTQKFDSIVKILSSTIEKITEADLSFVRGL
jgi:type III secretion system IpaD/SipD/SspD family effector